MLVDSPFLGQELTFKEEFVFRDSKPFSQKLVCLPSVLLGGFGSKVLFLGSEGRRRQAKDALDSILVGSHLTAVFRG